MSEHKPDETPFEEAEEAVEAHMLKEALAAGAASAALFAGQAAANAATPGVAAGGAVTQATAQASPSEQAPEEWAAEAERLAESARSLEFEVALLESASSDDPETTLVYAGPVEVALRALIETQSSVLDKLASAPSSDPNLLVQLVLRESYMQTQEDLRFFAEKVKYYNELKKAILDHLLRLEQDAKTTLYAADLISSLDRTGT